MIERVQAKHGKYHVQVLLDTEDFQRLYSRMLSIGSHGYVQIWDEQQVKTLQRWVLGLTRNDGLIADHINGDKLDNRRTNLRIVNPAESSANTASWGVSGRLGVYPTGGKWEARGTCGGRTVGLGVFDSIESAAQVAHEWRVKNLPGYITDRRSA